MKPQRSGVEILITMLAACLVLLVAMAVDVDRRTIAMLFALWAIVTAVITAGIVIVRLVDWIRAEVWPWLREVVRRA